MRRLILQVVVIGLAGGLVGFVLGGRSETPNPVVIRPPDSTTVVTIPSSTTDPTS